MFSDVIEDFISNTICNSIFTFKRDIEDIVYVIVDPLSAR